MRLCIRLQNHGKKNHPYWWIVVAPQHKNIFGLYTDHIGFWSPRHNVNIKRQVILNVPRLKYWLANGATPTFKVHKFLTMFGIFPKQWHYQKSAQQLAEQAKKQKPYEQMNAKQKSLKDRRKKRLERTALNAYNYHRYESMAMFPNKLEQKIMAKQHEQQFENSVIREILHEADYQKYDRLAELSANKQDSLPVFKRLQQVKQKIRKYKSELALLQKQHSQSRHVQKSKLIESLNKLTEKLSQIEYEHQRYRAQLPGQPQNKQQFITQNYLQDKLKHELITKKFNKSREQLQQIDKILEPITTAQLAAKLKQLHESGSDLLRQQENEDGDKSGKDEQIDFYELAEMMIGDRNQDLVPMTKLDLLVMQNKQYQEMVQIDDSRDDMEQTQGITNFKSYLDTFMTQDTYFPTIRPVHPRPDLKTYIPEQHYDPIDANKLDVLYMDSLEPHEQIEKYKKKRDSSQSVADRKKEDHRKRMQRLRLLTDS